jgi:hypothetical protein
MRPFLALVAAVLGLGAVAPSVKPAPPPAVRLAVLDFELNDFTYAPNSPAARAEAAQAGRMLRDVLGARCGYALAPVTAAAHRRANAAPGYLFARPADAAALGRDAGADWVVIGRLNRAGTVVSEFHVGLVRVSAGTLAAAVTVEIKGDAGDSVVFAKGVAHVARHLDRALAGFAGDSVAGRRCGRA